MGELGVATTILASLLPIYSSVAGSTLPSEATATAYWSLTISFSLFVLAILSPILGTISDVMRSKKRFLSLFIGAGVIGTGLAHLREHGDWLLASLVFVLGRIGFGGSIIFYDALLPHIARKEDRDWVSSRGYAWVIRAAASCWRSMSPCSFSFPTASSRMPAFVCPS